MQSDRESLASRRISRSLPSVRPGGGSVSIAMASSFPPDRGGVSDYSFELAKAVATHGCDLSVISYARQGEPEFRQFSPSLFVTRPLTRGLLLPGKFWAAVRRLQPQIVHVQSTLHLHPPNLDLFVLLKDHTPLLTTVHESSRSIRLFYITPFHRLLYRRSSAIIVLSNYAARMVHDSLSRGQALHVIPCGVDVGLYYPNIQQRHLKSRLSLESEFVVMFAGFIRRGKGIEHLLEAFRQFRERRKVGTLVLVGEIDETTSHLTLDPSYNSQIVQEISRLGLGRHVVRTGYLPEHELPLVLREADVIVFPYSFGHQSSMLPKALASGCATVVSDAGGLSEHLIDRESALVVAPDNVRALVAAIDEVYLDRSLATSLGQKARQVAVKELSWEVIATMQAEIYRALIG